MASKIRALTIRLRTVTSLALFLVSSCAASAASADEPTPQAADHAEYDTVIDAALTEFRNGHFSEARALFERAHTLFPNARTLRGMGVAAFAMRDYPHALLFLREALEHPTLPLTAQMRDEATTLLSRVTLFVARIELASAPENAHVLVDGRAAVTEDAWILVAPGSHTISVEAEGMRSRTFTIEATSGATQRLVVELVPLVAPEPTAPVRLAEPAEAPRNTPTPAPASMPAPAPSREETSASGAPWTLVAGGGVLVIVGASLGSVGLARARDEESDPQSARRLGRAGDSLMSTGIALGVTGIVWRVVSRRRTSPDVSVAVDSRRAHVLVGVRF